MCHVWSLFYSADSEILYAGGQSQKGTRNTKQGERELGNSSTWVREKSSWLELKIRSCKF